MVKPYQLKLFLSNKYAYAQIARQVDGSHAILVAASTVEKALQEDLKSKADANACGKYVGDSGCHPLPATCENRRCREHASVLSRALCVGSSMCTCDDFYTTGRMHLLSYR